MMPTFYNISSGMRLTLLNLVRSILWMHTFNHSHSLSFYPLLMFPLLLFKIVDGKCSNATGLQLPGILDELFSYDGPLGAHFAKDAVSLYLWAPTAQVCQVLLHFIIMFVEFSFNLSYSM